MACLIPLVVPLQSASAQTTSVEVAVLLRDPTAFVGQMIRVAAVRCANEPSGTFACGAERDGQLVRIESLALDFKTSAETRRKLSTRCRTLLAAASDACTFAAEFKPLNVTTSPSDGKSPKTVRFKTRRMNLY